jgi:hypothetical protein
MNRRAMIGLPLGLPVLIASARAGQSRQVEMRIQFSRVDPAVKVVAPKTPIINAGPYTAKLKCFLTNPVECTTPGATARIAAVPENRRGPSTPSAAIRECGGRAVAFVVTSIFITGGF